VIDVVFAAGEDEQVHFAEAGALVPLSTDRLARPLLLCPVAA